MKCEKLNNGWEWKSLAEVCEKITDGTHQTPTYFDSGITFLSSKNVTSGKIDWENIKYIDQKQHLELYKRLAPRMNDILLAKNGTTGVAALVDKDIEFDIYVSLALIRLKDFVLPKFMLHFTNSHFAKEQFNKGLKGAGVPNLHLEEIRKLKIPLSPLTVQKEIAEILDTADALRKKDNELLKKYDELAQSIFIEMFGDPVRNEKGWEVKKLEEFCVKITDGTH